MSIERITIQNEPQAKQTWESCLYSAKQEATPLHRYLKPALKRAGLDGVKTLMWDHNNEGMLDRASAVLSRRRAIESTPMGTGALNEQPAPAPSAVLPHVVERARSAP